MTNDKIQVALEEGTVIVTRGDVKITVAFNASGSVTLYEGGAIVYQQGGNDNKGKPKADIDSFPDPHAHSGLGTGKKTTATELKIGQMVEGKGIFTGTWTPADRAGHSLNQTFNLYAAPEDIGVLKTFNEAIKHVAEIRGLLGHDGFNHDVRGKTGDEALYDALRSGTYNGEWFIAPKNALNANLYANKDEGDLKGTFKTKDNGSDRDFFYCSSTECGDRDSSGVWGQSFSHGGTGWNYTGRGKMSTRLVRAELLHTTDETTGTVTKQAYNIGDVLPDGWVVGPVSPETGIVMAIEPAENALDGYQTWYAGEDHAVKLLHDQGHANARQPTDTELNTIYNEVVEAGRNDNTEFDNTSDSNLYGAYRSGMYWSSTLAPDLSLPDLARIRFFNDGGRRARTIRPTHVRMCAASVTSQGLRLRKARWSFNHTELIGPDPRYQSDNLYCGKYFKVTLK